MLQQIKITDWEFDDLYSELFWDEINNKIYDSSSVDHVILWESLADEYKYQLFDDTQEMFETWITILDAEAYNLVTQMILTDSEYIYDFIPYTDAYAQMISMYYTYATSNTDDGSDGVNLIEIAESYDCVAIVQSSQTMITGNNNEQIQKMTSIFISNGYYLTILFFHLSYKQTYQT